MEGPGRIRLPGPVSTYRKKLVQEIYRKLRKAVDTPSQRAEILHQLFTDVALEAEPRAQARLYDLEEVPVDGIAANTKFGDRSVCFYEILAEHYAQEPEDTNEVLPLFVKLWSQSLAAQTFSLLFYKWLFDGTMEDLTGVVRYATAFIEGASTVFWIDLESNVRRFYSLYQYILKDVFMSSKWNLRVRTQDRHQLVLMLSRFFFFYEPATELEEFLSHFPQLPMNLGAADVFVIELTDQMQKVKVEPVLLQYLKSSEWLKGLQLRVTTSTRLRTALCGFTSPGGPMYPTRAVRHSAWEALDCLFPVGRMPRHMISAFFRMMHPYYWPLSFWNFVMMSITGTIQSIQFYLMSIWEWAFGRR